MKPETFATFNVINKELEDTYRKLLALGMELGLENHKKESNYILNFAVNLADKFERVITRMNKLDTKEMKAEDVQDATA